MFFPQNVDNCIKLLVINYFVMLVIFSTMWKTQCGKPVQCVIE